MAKVVLDNVLSLSNAQSALALINNNNDTIEEGFENTLSRDGATPNQMAASLDMNSNRILNLPRPTALTEPLRLEDLNDFVGGTLTVIDRSAEEDDGIYDADNNSIASFVPDGGTDNTPMWNTFMLAVKNGTVKPHSTLRFTNQSGSYYRFASRPIQMASNLKLEGISSTSMWFIRDYQPGQVLAVSGTLEDSGIGRTVIVTGPLVVGHNVAITFGTPSVSINKLIATGDTVESLARFYVDQINASATLVAAGIFARQAYVGPETFTIVHPSGDPVITETDPDSNLSIVDPVSVTLTTNPISSVAVDQIVGIFQVSGTSGANGTFYAGYVSATKVLLIGSQYDSAYTGGGALLTAPLEPFIELGPQSVNDVYAGGQEVDKILVYAGTGVGGIAFDIGSHAVGSTIQGSSYRPIINSVQVYADPRGPGYWWVGLRIDGSNSLPDDAFEGARDMIVNNAFISGAHMLYTCCWLRSISSGTFTDFHIVDFGTELKGGLILDGTHLVKNAVLSIDGPTVGDIFIGPYVDHVCLRTGGLGTITMFGETNVTSNTFISGGVTHPPVLRGDQNKVITSSKSYSTGDTFETVATGAYDFQVGGTSRLAISAAGAVSNKGTTALFPNISTTASAANAFLNSSSSNSLLRSTSVGKYKTNRNKISVEDAYKVLDQLDPITYNSLAEADDKERTYVGMIAEEVHDQTAVDGKSPLVQYAEDTPDGLMYDRLALYLIPIVKDLKEQIKELKAKE